MEPVLDLLNVFTRREQAIFVWLAIAAIYVARSSEVRSGFASILKSLFSWKLLIPFGSAAAYSTLVVLLAYVAGLWHTTSLKETLYWFFGTALVLVGNALVAAGDPSRFRKLLKNAFKLTILIEFLVAFYVFPLLVELVLVPAVTLLVMVELGASTQAQFAPVRKVANVAIATVGLGLLTIATIRAATDLDGFMTRSTLEQLLAPPVLTLALLPLLYAWSVVSGYEQLFSRIGFFSEKGRPYPQGVRSAIVRACGLSMNRLGRFSRQFTSRLHALRTQHDLSAMMADFDASERARSSH